MLAKLFAKVWKVRSSLLRSEAGNVLMVTGLAMPVLLGIAGLGIEGAAWYNTRRSMQNAADAAVIAAATNAASNYQAEARAVAAQYGFTHNTASANGTQVTASNAATCPAGGTNCYSVTITHDIPLVFSRVVGFAGDATVGTQRVIRLTTTAIAGPGTTTRNYCVLTLGDGTGLDTLALDTNGAPKADLSGCNVGSKESMNCSGHNLGADWADAMGTVNGCGVNRVSNVSAINDPYQALNSQIPADTTCGGSYPGVTWNSNKALTSTPTRICGNLNITGDVTLTGSGQIVIYNGNLVLSNGVTFKTDTGASASIIFAGTNNSSYGHTFTGGNKNTVLEIEAPSTGTWAGIAIYQKYELTTNVNTEFSGGGNSPTFKITGVVYLPRAHLQLSGSVSKATDGAACLILVSATMRLNGGGELLDRSGCPSAGITMPTGTVSGRTKLVD